MCRARDHGSTAAPELTAQSPSASRIDHSGTGQLSGIDYVFFVGIWLRMCIFVFLGPSNGDTLGHLDHIQYVRQHHSVPPAGVGHETWQPPLYYVIAALLSVVSDDPKFIQLISLATSIATLWVAREIARSDVLLKTANGKALALSLVSFLPQFVVYGLQVSNDSLAVLLGFLAFYEASRLLAQPGSKAFLKVVSVLTAGLLTKGQFLVIVLVLFPASCILYWRRSGRTWYQKPLTCALAIAILSCGCGKYIQNTWLYGRPFLSNMDFNPDWLKANQGTYRGWHTALDVNVLKLIREPVVSDSTRHSIPLLLYGSFWYCYMIDSNFRAGASARPRYIGRYMDFIGLAPTALLALGALVVLKEAIRWLVPGHRRCEDSMFLRSCSVLAFTGNIAMVICMFIRFDAWSTLQARHLFPTLVGASVSCDVAIGWLKARFKTMKGAGVWYAAFLVGVWSYFVVEIITQLRGQPT
jgi:hypothetical protein